MNQAWVLTFPHGVGGSGYLEEESSSYVHQDTLMVYLTRRATSWSSSEAFITCYFLPSSTSWHSPSFLASIIPRPEQDGPCPGFILQRTCSCFSPPAPELKCPQAKGSCLPRAHFFLRPAASNHGGLPAPNTLSLYGHLPWVQPLVLRCSSKIRVVAMRGCLQGVWMELGFTGSKTVHVNETPGGDWATVGKEREWVGWPLSGH